MTNSHLGDSGVRLELVRDALRLSGHGLHPNAALTLARRYLDVDLLPGSVVTDEMVEKALGELARAKEINLARETR